MWGTQRQTKHSEFFKGINIFGTLEGSLFGKIKNVVGGLVNNNPVELAKYKLPKVIVMGNESTGKSSLLENITKCQLFPRHSKLCTKAVVHLILNNGDEKYVVKYGDKSLDIDQRDNIYKEIKKIMDELPSDSISEEEIIIEMTDKDLPNFEFFDLPGIRSYPQNMADTTTNLCKKYLADKDSIILCVVPVTITRLTSCQSIALINEMKMEHNCILALTMSDRLQMENVEDLLIKRLLQTSDEIIDLHFAGYIAIVNRLHTDNFNLEENDDIEKNWFHTNILSVMPEEYADHKLMIEQNITVFNLLRKMDELYNKFIRVDWIPKINAKITDDINAVQFDIDDLGLSTISKTLFNNIFRDYVDKVLMPTFTPTRIMNVSGTRASISQHEIYNQILSEIFDYCPKSGDEMTALIHNDFVKRHDGLKLYKFESAIDDVVSQISEKYNAMTKKHIRHIKTAAMSHLDDMYIHGYNLSSDNLKDVCHHMSLSLINYNLFPSINIIDGTETYEEAPKYAVRRNSLINKLTVLQNYKDSINNI